MRMCTAAELRHPSAIYGLDCCEYVSNYVQRASADPWGLALRNIRLCAYALVLVVIVNTHLRSSGVLRGCRRPTPVFAIAAYSTRLH